MLYPNLYIYCIFYFIKVLSVEYHNTFELAFVTIHPGSLADFLLKKPLLAPFESLLHQNS